MEVYFAKSKNALLVRSFHVIWQAPQSTTKVKVIPKYKLSKSKCKKIVLTYGFTLWWWKPKKKYCWDLGRFPLAYIWEIDF